MRNDLDLDSGYTKIPPNLLECMKDDPSSVNAVGWILKIEKWGKILILILTIIGIAQAVGFGFFCARLDVTSHEEFSLIPCLIIVGLTLVTDFIVYIVFQVIRLHLITQAEIVNNSKMIAKLTAYLADKNE